MNAITRIKKSIRKRRTYSAETINFLVGYLKRNKGFAKWANLCINILYKNCKKRFVNKQKEGISKGSAGSRALYLGGDAPENFEIKVFNNPKVSIIIPVYNNFEYTRQCIWSIVRNTGDVSYEIIVADDCSTDKTCVIEDIIKGVKHIKTGNNCGFLKNCNHASRYAEGEYVLFLNNDTIVQDNWLMPLISCIENDASVGLVGSKFIYPDNTLQEAGGIVFRDGTAMNYGRNKNPEDIEFNYVKEVDYISGASILLKKELWKELNGFDVRFAPAYCEDSDLAMRIRYEKKLKVIYQPKSEVVHFEGKSNGTDVTTGLKKYQIENSHKLLNKWSVLLNKYHAIDVNQIFLAKDHSYNKKTILVIDWKVLSFTKDTGSRATYQYMQFFKICGFNVKLWAHDYYIEDDFLDRHLQDGFEVLSGCISGSFEDWVRENGKFIDYIYLNRPDIAKIYIDKIRKYSNAKVIYQGHDLHYLRKYRERISQGKNEEAEKLLPEERKFELDICRKMDVACYVSTVEVAEVHKLRPDINVKAIPISFYDISEKKNIKYDAQTRSNIAFVAGFRHTPNIDGVIWFCNKIFPKIREKCPGIKLYIVGSSPVEEVKRLACDDVIVTGYVSDEKLNDIYKNIRLTVVPLLSGAGVKGKVIESIYNKVPVITTNIGAEGIANDDNLITICNDEDSFTRTVIEYYNDFSRLNNISEKSIDYIDRYFSFNAVKRELGSIIPEILL